VPKITRKFAMAITRDSGWHRSRGIGLPSNLEKVFDDWHPLCRSRLALPRNPAHSHASTVPAVEASKPPQRVVDPVIRPENF
jgi:hypothetical protein